MDVSPEGRVMPEGGAGVVVTLDEMYRLLVRIDRTVGDLVSADQRILAELAKHETRLNSHDKSIAAHGERLGALEAWRTGEERGDPPRANAATIASVIVAGLSVAVAVIAIIVGALKS